MQYEAETRTLNRVSNWLSVLIGPPGPLVGARPHSDLTRFIFHHTSITDEDRASSYKKGIKESGVSPVTSVPPCPVIFCP